MASSNHRRRRSRSASTQERQEHIAHRPRTDEDRQHLAAMYARDAARADAALGPYKEPRVIKGHRFIFCGVHLQEETLREALYKQFEARGLCAVVSLGYDEMSAAVLYVDERISINDISQLAHSVKFAIDHTPNPEQMDLSLLTDQALAYPDFEHLSAISQEYLAS
jgi:hypothetical protein